MRRIPMEVHGYSLPRILIFGLILPAIVTCWMVGGLALAFYLSLTLLMKFVFLALFTLIGFTVGTLTMLRLTGRMLRFAKIRREGE